MTRTGVFLCTCDGRIDKSIDVDAVERTFVDKPVVSQRRDLCQPNGTRALANTIGDHRLDRVVIAACPARLQEKRLRTACTDAGVNINHLALVDWREGCAGAHRSDRDGATRKAIDIVRMGVAQVENASVVEPATANIVPRAAVIGGGIAGMTVARALADRGIPVTLVEQDAQLGGQLRDGARSGIADAYTSTLAAVVHHPNIELRLSSRIVGIEGPIGQHRIEVQNSIGMDTFDAGAIVIATGAQEYRPTGLYRYDARRVVTLGEFEKEITRPPSAIVYILCAGSRDARVSYCPNTCCMASLDQALRCKRANPGTRITILFRDLYLLGDAMNEEIVREARHAGIEFARYTPTLPPRVDEEFVELDDALTCKARRIAYDRVVLAAPFVPRAEAGVLARLLHLTRDENGFFVDPHLRLRPEQQTESGIFICGSAHRPVDADEAILQGMTAAARAARFLHLGAVTGPAWGAIVNAELCTGCAQCVESCAFGAIRLTVHPLDGERGMRSVVDSLLCKACGSCVVACPSKAIEIPDSSDAQIFAQIAIALGVRESRRTGGEAEGHADDQPISNPTGVLRNLQSPISNPPLLVFACEWSGFAAMELAGARRMQYPASVRVIELPCSARLDPLHVMYAFFNGADRVLLALCPPNECHFGNGNQEAERRIENLRAQLAAHGIDPQRLGVARMMGDDAEAWLRAVSPTNGE